MLAGLEQGDLTPTHVVICKTVDLETRKLQMTAKWGVMVVSLYPHCLGRSCNTTSKTVKRRETKANGLSLTFGYTLKFTQNALEDYQSD